MRIISVDLFIDKASVLLQNGQLDFDPFQLKNEEKNNYFRSKRESIYYLENSAKRMHYIMKKPIIKKSPFQVRLYAISLPVRSQTVRSLSNYVTKYYFIN